MVSSQGLTKSPGNLDITLSLTRDGSTTVMQASNTNDMINSVQELVSFLSQGMHEYGLAFGVLKRLRIYRHDAPSLDSTADRDPTRSWVRANVELLHNHMRFRKSTRVFPSYVRKPPVFLQPGDDMAVTIEEIGTLSNPVCAAEQN